MLDTVLLARDRWLAPDGVIFPDKASVMLCAIEDAQYKADKIDFWDDVYGFDMSTVKRMALAEPLVDTVAAEQIVTNTACVKTIDIMTMTRADCCIDAPFELRVTRNDYVHALVAYFDVHFTACHKPLGFSTGPKARATHWKQTVFYLDAAPAVCAGESLSGRITCAPNARNVRDLDIALEFSLQGKRAQMAGRQEYRMR
jgi:protein arginine N-methyltransferase 1